MRKSKNVLEIRQKKATKLLLQHGHGKRREMKKGNDQYKAAKNKAKMKNEIGKAKDVAYSDLYNKLNI